MFRMSKASINSVPIFNRYIIERPHYSIGRIAFENVVYKVCSFILVDL